LTPDARTRFYLPELDGLRCLAVLAVFLFHVPRMVYAPQEPLHWTSAEWWGRSVVLAGAFGVDLFFVLSGFLITSLLLREAADRGQIDLWAFWVRRALRIWPLYFVYLGLCTVLQGLPLAAVAPYAVFLANWPIGAGTPSGALIGLLWSVQVEEQFYLVWPLVMALVPRRVLPEICFGMIVASVGYRFAVVAGGGTLENIALHTLARLDPLAVGALIALGRPAVSPAMRRLLGVSGPIAVVVCAGVLSHEILAPGGGHLSPLVIKTGLLPALATSLVFLVIAVACGGILLAALGARRSWLAHPVPVSLGRISYGIYVVHLASLRLVASLWWPWRGFLGLGITLSLAALSYRVLEQPFLRLKERFTYVRSSPETAMADIPAGRSN
jgi:peptidoglycan/LPS O-acetylase OafA/YrhL